MTRPIKLTISKHVGLNFISFKKSTYVFQKKYEFEWLNLEPCMFRQIVNRTYLQFYHL